MRAAMIVEGELGGASAVLRSTYKEFRRDSAGESGGFEAKVK